MVEIMPLDTKRFIYLFQMCEIKNTNIKQSQANYK